MSGKYCPVIDALNLPKSVVGVRSLEQSPRNYQEDCRVMNDLVSATSIMECIRLLTQNLRVVWPCELRQADKVKKWKNRKNTPNEITWLAQHSHIPAEYMLTMQFAFVTPLKMQAFHMLQNAKVYAKNSICIRSRHSKCKSFGCFKMPINAGRTNVNILSDAIMPSLIWKPIRCWFHPFPSASKKGSGTALKLTKRIQYGHAVKHNLQCNTLVKMPFMCLKMCPTDCPLTRPITARSTS